jgi:G6PDH family F420-dependent oxidoreductase
MTSTRFGYTLMTEQSGPRQIVDYAGAAERAGFDFEVMSDHYFPWLDEQGHAAYAWSMMGAVTQVTERVELMTYVTCPIMRYHPAVVAQKAATIGLLSDNRFTLGLGSGENLNEHVTGEWWPPSEVRREMLEEAVDVIRKLWEGRTVEHLGKHFTVDNARIYSLPEEPPAIIFAASGEPGAELAGRVGDGLIGIEASTELVHAFAEAGGAGKPCHGEMAVCVAPDRDEALRIAHAQWAAPGATPPRLSAKLRVAADFQAVADLVTEEQVAEKVVCGADPDEHLARIEEFADAGFDHVFVHQVGDDQETFFRFYEDEILPRVGEL